MSSITYRELLRNNKNFRRLWTGQLISELGTWFSFIAELGLVRLLSGSALATTGLLIARMLPFLLVAPFAGVFVDRRSRKQILIGTDLLRAVVAILYLAAGTLGSVWYVFACAALESSLTVFFEAARNASVPNLVAPRELLTANVMVLSTRFLQFTLGAALGGVAAVHFGYDVAFVINAISFVLSAMCIAPIPARVMRRSQQQSTARAQAAAASAAATERAPEDEGRQEALLLAEAIPADAGGALTMAPNHQPFEEADNRFFSDLRKGFGYIWATPFVRGIILINIGWAMGGGMNNILYEQLGGHVFARGEGDRGDAGVALLFTAAGVGLVIGMMMARRAGAWVADERRAGLFIGWSLIAHGLLFCAAGFMPSLELMAVMVAASRLLLAMEFGVQETMLMRVTPDEYRGRVFTTDRSFEYAMMTISMIIAGWLLGWFSPRQMMVVSGLLSASPGAFWLLALWLKQVTVPARAVRESFGD